MSLKVIRDRDASYYGFCLTWKDITNNKKRKYKRTYVYRRRDGQPIAFVSEENIMEYLPHFVSMQYDYARIHFDANQSDPHIRQQKPKWNQSRETLTDGDPYLIFRSVTKATGFWRHFRSTPDEQPFPPNGFGNAGGGQPQAVTTGTTGTAVQQQAEAKRLSENSSSGSSNQQAVFGNKRSSQAPSGSSSDTAPVDTGNFQHRRKGPPLTIQTTTETRRGTASGPVSGTMVQTTPATASGRRTAAEGQTSEGLTMFPRIELEGQTLPQPPQSSTEPSSSVDESSVEKLEDHQPDASNVPQLTQNVEQPSLPVEQTSERVGAATQGMTPFPPFDPEGNSPPRLPDNTEQGSAPDNQDPEMVRHMVDGAQLEPEGQTVPQLDRDTNHSPPPAYRYSYEGPGHDEPNSEPNDPHTSLLPQGGQQSSPPAVQSHTNASTSVGPRFSFENNIPIRAVKNIRRREST
ncbi:hypothetical protein H2201_003635 [Coniosporium apollinis]|uniref:PH domain-containing protein n=2 Tax=Coniosporium TaxID=2810619 RepID=A0ABQ9NYR9_9PEZI|nr:hypothetical protein H2199_002825 [Cladosporium sp. JES 115]KAJ9666201.1 hypothetical protein H2201_003635 [Coniosporium apollinis]